MRSEDGGAWFVPANGGDETAVLIKAPTSSLKALLAGARLSFMFGRDGGYLCSGVRIYDVPDAPILLYSVQRHQEEHEALRKIASERTTPVFLFNELDVCVAWSDGKLWEAVELLPELIFDAYCGDFNSEMPAVLDAFCEAVERGRHCSGTEFIRTLEIPISLGPWTSNNISFAGVHGLQTIVLEDSDEGAVL